jgi:hypothetical protein
VSRSRVGIELLGTGAFCGFDGQVFGATLGIDAAHVRWFAFRGREWRTNLPELVGEVTTERSCRESCRPRPAGRRYSASSARRGHPRLGRLADMTVSLHHIVIDAQDLSA